MNLLERIVRAKEAEIELLKALWKPGSTHRGDPLDVVSMLERRRTKPGADPLRVLAEVKFRSPSAGYLSRRMNAGERALAYARAGASMVSILCDTEFFGGSWDDLTMARAALRPLRRPVPILAKEFILDPIQLCLARAKGADAALLIARIVSPERLAELVRAAKANDLTPIVEVTNAAELAAALSTTARIIGVNARDLDTLTVDASGAGELLAGIPGTHVALHFSGMKTVHDVRAVASGRADGALIGEALMREDDPTPLLTNFVEAAKEE